MAIEESTRQRIEDLIASDRVVLFMKGSRTMPQCGFSATTVGILEKSLQKHGFNAAALHGDMDQHARLRTLNAFRDGEITYLIASDVAARGLDIPDVSHVYNFDIPTRAEDYVHRIGRTGRAGRKGNSVTLVQPDEFKYLKDVEKLIEKDIEWLGDAPTEEEIAQASAKRGRGRGRGGDKSRGRKSTGAKRSEKRADSKRPEKAVADKREAPKKSRGDRRSRRPLCGSLVCPTSGF